MVKMNRERIPRWRNGKLRQQAADLASVVAAMRNDMEKHFPTRHAASITIREDEGQGFGQKFWSNGFEIAQVPLIGCSERRTKLRWGGHLKRIVVRIAMCLSGKMRSKYPADDE